MYRYNMDLASDGSTHNFKKEKNSFFTDYLIWGSIQGRSFLPTSRDQQEKAISEPSGQLVGHI